MEWLFHSLSEVGCWVEIQEKNPYLLHVMLPLGGTLQIRVGNNAVDSYLYQCKVEGRYDYLTNNDCDKKKIIFGIDTIWHYRLHDYHGLPVVVARLNDDEVALRNQAQQRSLVFMGVLRRQRLVCKDMAWLLGRTHYALELKRARDSL